jgi:AraC-like DNA-binding protein
MRQNVQHNLQLETVAAAFGMSAASLKRKLSKHNTHFQEQLDLVRKHVALYLYQIKGYQHHEVADYLRFNDINNFRRAFKRWTGLPPRQLLQANYF